MSITPLHRIAARERLWKRRKGTAGRLAVNGGVPVLRRLAVRQWVCSYYSSFEQKPCQAATALTGGNVIGESTNVAHLPLGL